jgi:hypothetical protein
MSPEPWPDDVMALPAAHVERPHAVGAPVAERHRFGFVEARCAIEKPPLRDRDEQTDAHGRRLFMAFTE